MTKAERESLSDNSGRCCKHSVKDEKTGKIKLLAVACRYLVIFFCRCLVYKDRFWYVRDCQALSSDWIKRIRKLPFCCAYRSLVECRKLGSWHQLVSGDPNKVHEAGISVKDKVVSGVHVNPDDLEYFHF